MPSHKILKIAKPSNSLCDQLNKELGLPEILAQILINRGISTAQEAERFLNVNPEHLLDPFLFKDMRKAVSRIQGAGRDKEEVMVFGDYDADGITALVLLKDTLKKIGVEALHYLPHRIKEVWPEQKYRQAYPENKSQAFDHR